MEPRLFDAHCHLDLMTYPNAVADETAAIGLGVFDCGVDPRDFAATKKRASWARFLILTGGELGIRTPEGLCGPYSLSRRAPSASRSALRNSRSIVTKQPKLGKREFSNCLAAFPPCSFRPYPSERLREPSSSLPMVRHIWKMQPRARKKKPLSTS